MVYGLSVLLLCCYLVVFSGSTERRSGPYDWVLEKMDNCPESGTDESVFNVRMTKITRNRAVLNGTFWLYPSIDEDSKVVAELQQWGNQGYRPRSFMISAMKCSKMWKEAAPNIKKLFSSVGVNLTGCPFPAGNYSSENMEMDFKIHNIPVMVYNKYRIVINLYHGKRKVGCSRFYGDVVPKLEH